jgi:hypothetical protein
LKDDQLGAVLITICVTILFIDGKQTLYVLEFLNFRVIRGKMDEYKRRVIRF